MPKIICVNCRNIILVGIVERKLTKSGKISKTMINEGLKKLEYANTHAKCCNEPDYRGE